MALPGNKDFNDYDNYVTDPNPTTSAQAQDYFHNQAELLKAVIDCDFWQPETTYQPGDVVKSDSMPNGTEAVMVATKASVTSNIEPQWGAVGGANISDGACFWKLRWQHWSKEVASVDDMKNGTSNDKIVTPKLARLGQTATNRLPNTAYSVGNVVYTDTNLSVALKCTTAGTTSNAELNISNNNIGDTVTDGSVVWQVCNRTSDVTSVNGKTGDVVVDTLPVGTSIIYMGDTVPDGYLAENGAAISRTTYAKLFAVIGTKYGAGDGSTTFNLPNTPQGRLITGDIPLSGNADVYGNGKAIKFTNGGTTTFGLTVYESAGTKTGRIYGFAYESANLPNQQDSAMYVNSQCPGVGLATKSIGGSAVYADTSSITANTSTMPIVRYCIKY